MKVLRFEERDRALRFLSEAAKEAKKATCLERKCGAVLVSNGGIIIGRGSNSPPGNLESQRRCGMDKSAIDKKITERTCCIHAERRALRDAIRKKGNTRGSVMYFTSIDEDGNRLPSGKPYCTDCSKTALDEGIAGWVLEHNLDQEGIVFYDAGEYNNLSFNYKS